MTVDQLILTYDLIDRKKDYEVIDFFERNALTIQNLDENKDQDTLVIKTNLLSDYGYSLAKNGLSSKSIPVLTEALRLHQKHPEFNDNKLNVNGYQRLLFLLAEALYRTERFDESRQAFESLLTLSPNNEGYKSWVVTTTNHKRRKISRFVFVAFTVWLLVSVLLKDMMVAWLRLTFNLIGMALFITWTVVDVKNWLIKRKYK